MDKFFIPIPHTELKEGIKLSIENAERLINDAEILYNNGGHNSASYLCIAALEEEGKASILLRRSLDNKDVTKKYWDEKILDHGIKIIAVQRTILNYRKLRIKIGSERWKQVDLADLAKFFLKSKDKCLYVDWDFETRRTQITDKWESPLKDIKFEGVPLVDENKRRETANSLIYEAKLGLEATRMIVKKKTPHII